MTSEQGWLSTCKAHMMINLFVYSWNHDDDRAHVFWIVALACCMSCVIWAISVVSWQQVTDLLLLLDPILYYNDFLLKPLSLSLSVGPHNLLPSFSHDIGMIVSSRDLGFGFGILKSCCHHLSVISTPFLFALLCNPCTLSVSRFSGRYKLLPPYMYVIGPSLEIGGWGNQIFTNKVKV